MNDLKQRKPRFVSEQQYQLQQRARQSMLAFERRIKRRFAWAILIMLCIAMIWGAISLLTKQKQQVVEEISGVPLYMQMIPYGAPGRPGMQREVKYIVIHETANEAKGADAENHARYLSQVQDTDTSWHYTVDDHEIWQQLPDEEVGWHAGDQQTPDGGNMCGIGVELCVNSDGDFTRTMQNGAKLTAHLLLEHGLELSAVRQHCDFSGKDCPHIIRSQGRWEAFLQMVQTEMARQQG